MRRDFKLTLDLVKKLVSCSGKTLEVLEVLELSIEDGREEVEKLRLLLKRCKKLRVFDIAFHRIYSDLFSVLKFFNALSTFVEEPT